MWSLYVDSSSSAVEHMYIMWQTYLFRAYNNNVKCLYTNALGYTVDCGE